MDNLMTPEELIAFETDIADCFNQKMIKAPIHLYDGNEEQMLEVFKEVKPNDWCVCSWRSHYQCLLKGMPPEKVKADILDGRSIEMCNKEYKIFSSAIVAGNIPIALGIAKDIQRKGGDNRVWCFVGEMTATTGQFREAMVYSIHHKLPIKFVVEDNSKSVCTITRETWNTHKLPYEPDEIAQGMLDDNQVYKSKYLWYYKYKLDKYPHAGSGTRIQF